MKNINVIVIPERREFINDITFRNEMYVNIDLGVPKLKNHNCMYAAPFWLDGEQGVDRVYHIESVRIEENCTVLALGNSFKLSEKWNAMGNHRKFEYHRLEEFGFVEIKEGLLLSI